MKKNRKKIKRSALPQIRKHLKNYCFNEEGKISKKSIAKIGLTLAFLASTLDSSQANHNSGVHNSAQNVFFATGDGGHASGTVATHASHPSHTSHGSHGQW
jgi:hypothetical protein